MKSLHSLTTVVLDYLLHNLRFKSVEARFKNKRRPNVQLLNDWTPFTLCFYSFSFKSVRIRLRLTAKIAIAPCICIPNRPADDATSYPCLCFNSLFFASIFITSSRFFFKFLSILKRFLFFMFCGFNGYRIGFTLRAVFITTFAKRIDLTLFYIKKVS